MNFIKNNLANAFTLGNLFSGSIAAISIIQKDYSTAIICIIVSLILDFFDGFIARALKSNSNLGAQLDSLADMVSFGLVPGLMMVNVLEGFNNEILGFHFPFSIKYFGLLITLLSCLRLAIFNLDEEQSYYFKGLNTPSNTILILGLFAIPILKNNHFLSEFLGNYYSLFVALFIILSSWLLISPIKMIAMKFKSTLLKDNYPKMALLLGTVLLFITFGIIGIPLIILYYILISILFQKKL